MALSQLQKLKIRLNNETKEEDEQLLSLLLDDARMMILNKRFPFSDYDEDEELETRYLDLQVRIAVELFTRIGAEGELQHSEAGVTRQYKDGRGCTDLLAEVIPKAKVIG